MGEIIRTTTERGGRTLEDILIDGTFKYCPTFLIINAAQNICAQLMTKVSELYRNHVLN